MEWVNDGGLTTLVVLLDQAQFRANVRAETPVVHLVLLLVHGAPQERSDAHPTDPKNGTRSATYEE